MSDHLRTAFIRQGEIGSALGSPFMAKLMPLIGVRLSAATRVGARCLAWEGDVSAGGQSVPLRLAGALHGLVLDGSDAGLIAAYPPHRADDGVLWHAVEQALIAHDARIMAWLDRPPQTNEVRRAAAIIAGLWWALDRVGPMPVILSEMGASGGLNLSLDRFTLSTGPDHVVSGPVPLTPTWRGAPPSPQRIDVIDRAGVDQAPLDPSDPADALRLLAYLWPDQPERVARTRSAIALSDTRVQAGDAAPWLARRLAVPWTGLHVVYTTVAAQYFPQATQGAIGTSLRAAGQRAHSAAPLLHLAMESDADRPGAGLTATLWGGGAPVQHVLARVDFHVAWIEWRDEPSPQPRFPLAFASNNQHLEPGPCPPRKPPP